jgi:hypothetical protein
MKFWRCVDESILINGLDDLLLDLDSALQFPSAITLDELSKDDILEGVLSRIDKAENDLRNLIENLEITKEDFKKYVE